MATTFLNLTNELLRRLNEVQVDTTDFANVRNVQALAKDAINNSVRTILQSAQEWPFALTTKAQTLTAGTNTYAFPTDLSSVDWESFYIKQLASKENTPQKLPVLTYPDYISKYRPYDDESGASGQQVPLRIFQTQESKFGVSPVPDDEYVIEYKYWSFPSSMTSATSTCIIPSRFDHVIIDGAMMYMMRFRSNDQSAQIHQAAFEEGIKMMRRLLVDDQNYLRSTYITRYRYNSLVTSDL
jgi:hypothetical protein